MSVFKKHYRVCYASGKFDDFQQPNLDLMNLFLAWLKHPESSPRFASPVREYEGNEPVFVINFEHVEKMSVSDSPHTLEAVYGT